jgi:uncharacterized Zn-finger protein
MKGYRIVLSLFIILASTIVYSMDHGNTSAYLPIKDFFNTSSYDNRVFSFDDYEVLDTIDPKPKFSIDSEIENEDFCYIQKELDQINTLDELNTELDAYNKKPETMDIIKETKTCESIDTSKDTSTTTLSQIDTCLSDVTVDNSAYILESMRTSHADESQNSITSVAMEKTFEEFYKKNKFECTICHKFLSSKSDLKVHEQTHFDDLPKFECPICHTLFSAKKSLKAHHIRKHTNSFAKFECPVCHKSFSTKPNLTAHKRIHTGETPYACTFESCNQSFRTDSNRKRHELTHAPKKSFVCDIAGCTQSFNTSDNLKRHKEIHKPEKPFKCPSCDKSYADKGYLKKHSKIHTGEKSYICHICNKGFTLQTTLHHHMKSQH